MHAADAYLIVTDRERNRGLRKQSSVTHRRAETASAQTSDDRALMTTTIISSALEHSRLGDADSSVIGERSAIRDPATPITRTGLFL